MKRAKDKKVKKKIKVYKDDRGKFIRLKKKKIRLPPDITERQLLKFVINTLKPKRRKPKKESDETVGPYGKIKKIDPITWSVSQLVSKKNDDLENQRKELRALRNDVTSQQALIAPVAKLAITEGKDKKDQLVIKDKREEKEKEEKKQEEEEEDKPKYTDKQVQKGLKMLALAQREKFNEEQLRLKAEKAKKVFQKQSIEDKKKAIQKELDDELKEFDNPIIYQAIADKFHHESLKNLIRSAGLRVGKDKPDNVRLLLPTGRLKKRAI